MEGRRDATFVAVRVRPMRCDERKNSPKPCAVALEAGMVEATRFERKGGAYLRSQQSQQQSYKFDASFGPDSTQQEVYEATTRPHVGQVAKCVLPALTVMAYGATGAGKTHTIMGEGSLRGGGDASLSRQAGIIPRAVEDLFEEMEAGTRVGVSYLEVYNEKVYDLLLEASDERAPLRVCEDEKNGVVKVLGLTQASAKSSEGVLDAMRAGNARRTTEATGANDVSSRSHAVLQIRVTNPRGATSTVSLIDLAGSERASATGNRGARLAEAAHINKSLLALANCINALTDDAAPKPKYRDSKLTLLLKTSLESPTVRLVIVACVSPNALSVDDTFNTLKYAQRAKELPTTSSNSWGGAEEVATDFSVVSAATTAWQPRRFGGDNDEDGPPPKPHRRRSVAPMEKKKTRQRRGSLAPNPGGASSQQRHHRDATQLGDLRRASTVAVANARAAALAVVEDFAARGAKRGRENNQTVPMQIETPGTESLSRDDSVASSGTVPTPPPPKPADEDVQNCLLRELEKTRAQLRKAEARAERWRSAAQDIREHADALSAACRACVQSQNDVGALRARWDHGGLRLDVEAARMRWEQAIIADDAADKKHTLPLSEKNANVDSKQDAFATTTTTKRELSGGARSFDGGNDENNAMSNDSNTTSCTAVAPAKNKRTRSSNSPSTS